MKKKQNFIVNGMSCSNCSALIDNTLSNTNGISSCDISVLTKKMTVEYDDEIISVKDIQNKVKALGYKANVNNSNNKINPALIKLFVSIFLLLILVWISNYQMFHLPLFGFMKDYYVNGFTQMGLLLTVIIINNHYYRSGFMGIIRKAPNMDTLIMLSSLSAFIYGLVILILNLTGNVNNDLNNLYFESGAMIIVLVGVGKYLESIAITKTTASIRDLVKYLPKSGLKLINYPENNDTINIKVEEIKEDDYLLIKEGSEIPCDGVVIKGTGAVDESLLTGESILCNKYENSNVYKATILKEGFLIIKALKVGTNSLYDEIIELVNSSASSKTKIGRIADTICKFFVPTIVILAIIAFIIWFIISKDFNTSFSYALCVLVVSCPCALGLATPVAITSATGRSFKFYCLAKDATVYEALPKIKYALFDKTGTVTSSNMTIDQINNVDIEYDEFISYVVSIEKLSIHPFSVELAKISPKYNYEVSDYKSIPTKGLTGVINSKNVLIGNAKFLNEEGIIIPNDVISKNNTIYFAIDNEYKGFISFKDNIKEDSIEALKIFKSLGIKTILISGDNEEKTKEVALKLGFDEYYGNVFPKDKNEILMKYNKNNDALFIGDGINDSIAITNAAVSMAIGTGADIALENANVILKRNSLLDAVNLIMLSKKTLKIIKENLFWAFIYNLCLIPIAMGAFSSLNVHMKPMYGAIAMCCSSIIVVLNALRINGYKYKNKLIGGEEMVFSVPKMMCSNCQLKIDNALKALPNLDYEVKLETKEVIVKNEYDKKLVIKAIEDAGYKAKLIKK